MQGRLEAVLPCLRYVDTVAIGDFDLCLRGVCRRKKQVLVKNELKLKQKKKKRRTKKESRDLFGISPSAITGFLVFALSHSGEHDRTAYVLCCSV